MPLIVSEQVYTTTSEDPNPGEHLRLIHRVIHQMGLYGDIAEEAYSEGLVAVTEACQSYNPDKGPLANWLGNNIRWSIKSWLTWEKSKTSKQQELFPIENPKDSPENKSQFDELIRNMKKVLSKREYEVIIMTAVGYSGKEIGEKLNMSAVQVTRTKQHARNKLERYR